MDLLSQQRKLYLLGAPRLERDGAPLPIDRRKAMALLAYLALTGQTHLRDAIATLLWPDSGQPHARANLRHTLVVLKQALGSASLAITWDSVAFRPGALWVDVLNFQSLLATCRTHGHAPGDICAACIAPLTAAVALPAEQFMAGFSLNDSPAFDDWQRSQQQQLIRALSDTLDRLVGHFAAAAEYKRAIEYAQHRLTLDTLDEAAHRQLIQLYAWSGQQGLALRQFERCTDVLAQELGVSPAAETAYLAQAIREGRTSIPAERPHSTANQPPPPSTAALLRPAAPSPHNLPGHLPALVGRELGIEPNQDTQAAYAQVRKPAVSPVLHTTTGAESVGGERLVGREPEWKMLQVAWQKVLRGRAQFVCIRGEAGIGKTRLAEEMLNWVRHQGFTQARTRTYAAEGSLAYAPVTEWLRAEVFQSARKQLSDVWLSDVARLLPEILVERPDLPRPEPLSERWQRQRFFEALARTILAADQPLLLVIDDLQWCDPETVGWLAYLLRFDAKARLLLIGTLRMEELDADHPLLPLLLHLRTAEQLTELDLAPLDERETATLARQVTNQALDPGLLAKLYQETEGNPLFVVETLRASLSQQPVALASQATISSIALLPALPPKIHAVIHARLAQLSPAARSLAQLAATIGRAFTFAVVAQASGSEEEALVHSLDELWQRRIVREQDVNTYDFSHDRIREVAYHEIRPAQRRLLHKRVAQALVTLHANNLDEIHGQLGYHYEQALQFEDAVIAYHRAADQAEALYAFERVLFYLERMLTLLEKLPTTAASMQQQIKGWLKIADTLIIVKGWTTSERKQALDRAYELAKRVNDQSYRFDAILALRGYYGNIGDWDTSYRQAKEAVQLAETLQDPLRLFRAYHSVGNTLLQRGEFLSSLHYYQRALQLEAELDPTVSRNVTSNIRMAEALWLCGYPAQAQRMATEAICMVDEQGHPFGRIHVREFMWYTYQRVGDESTMRRLAAELSELCERFGMPDYVYPAKLFLGLAMVQDGVIEAGLQQMAQALAGLQQIGIRFNRSYFLSLLAQAQAQSGAIQAALHTLEIAQQIGEESGDRLWQAELVRLTGEYKLRLNYAASEVESYYHSALQITRQQNAKSLELRAVTSLARLWQTQGRQVEAHSSLAEIYGWFTEGFDTADLQEARTLLADLQS